MTQQRSPARRPKHQVHLNRSATVQRGLKIAMGQDMRAEAGEKSDPTLPLLEVLFA